MLIKKLNFLDIIILINLLFINLSFCDFITTEQPTIKPDNDISIITTYITPAEETKIHEVIYFDALKKDATNNNKKDENFNENKKLIEKTDHKSTDEAVNENHGNEINENHNVHTEESGETDTVSHDSDNDSSFHENDAEGIYVSKTVDSKKDQKRSFEKGFFNQYHKKEYHKLANFFGNDHKGGEYYKYGNNNNKKNSASEAAEKGKHSKASKTESNNKNMKIL